MENLDEIKEIWLSAKMDSLPAAESMVKVIKSYHLRQMLKAVLLVAVALALAALMSWVVINYKSNMVMTRLGEALIFISIFIILRASFGSPKRISTSGSPTNAAFLTFLKEEQQRQIRFQTKTKVIGFVIACAGLPLYLYEGLHDDTALMIEAYMLLAVWCTVSWFIIRPMFIKRNNMHINNMISKVERLGSQLGED